MTRIRAIVLAAQDEEARPVLHLLAHAATKPAKLSCPTGAGWTAASTHGNILVLRTGIGLTATASALGWALAHFSPRFVLSTGSAGGLATDIGVGDVVIGSSYAYGSADATAFGYVRGQIPGQPASFAGSSLLLEAVPPGVRQGLMLSGDSFVTAANVGDMRQAFPEALSTDMESAAAAQVCATWDIPFASIRCISDLCGPQAGQDYHLGLNDAAQRSAETAVNLLYAVSENARSGPAQRFSEASLRAALLLAFARVRKLPPESIDGVPAEIRGALEQQLEADGHLDIAPTALAAIAAAQKAIAQDNTLTLTAKQYDTQRAALVGELGLDSGRGHLSWPPTSQTIIKRFNGYWNDALEQVGLRAQSGRKRGGLKFSDRDYINALRAFATWSAKHGNSPSYKTYQEWLEKTGRRGVFPSGAAIRQRFGSWRAAASAAQI